MKRYILLYLDVAPKIFDEMQRNIKDGAWEQLRINAHSLKPQADFMGITGLKEDLIKIEEAVTLKNIDAVEKLVESSLTISEKSEEALRKILDEL